MSIEIMLVKRPPHVFKPATSDDADVLNRLENGKEYGCTITQLRNGKFHRKLFALLKFAYENTEQRTAVYNGVEYRQSFKRFRNDLVIMAGHYDYDVTMRGDVRATAKSLSYRECSQEDAEQIYSDLLDVICEKVFAGEYSKERLDEITDQLMGFA